MQTIIVGGGTIDAAFLKQRIEDLPEAIILAADRGMNALESIGRMPHCLMGDYDSIAPEVLAKVKASGTEVRTFPAEKDFTDTEAAILTALDMGSDQIHLLGVTGGRLDHFLGVVQNLLIPYEKDVTAIIEDPSNRLFMVGDRSGLWKAEKADLFGKYLSLIPITDQVTEVSLQGVKYPVDKMTLTKGSSLCVSNEVTEDVVTLEMSSGVVLVVLSSD
ncbi:MAG: thiamine diphosphokinase [Lachnospiraceae bacterium]|nr:thiamine diphosphokinase [Candidatus Equihabitans merdae]